MTVYHILYLLILLNAKWREKDGVSLEQKRRRTAVIPALLLILVFGLRHPSMGWDLGYGKQGGYLWSFKMISKYSLHELFKLGGWLNYEWGYIFYNKLLGYISYSEQWLLFVSAVLSFLPIAVLFAKCSRNIEFSYIVYMGLPCFLMPFSGVRQGIAIAISALATVSICNKDRKRFLITMLIAALFHSSAAIYLLAYPLYYWRPPKDIRILMVAFLGVIYAARYRIFGVASKLFRENAVADNNNAFMLLLVFVLIFIFCQVFCRNEDESSIGFLNIFYFACICQCFGGVYSIAMRVGYYFMPSVAVALPNILTSIPDQKDRRVLQFIIILIFIIYGIYALEHSSWPMANPYHFFWQKV